VCRQALEQERPLAELLNQHKEVKAHLSEEEIEHLTDPAAYLGLASAMVDRVLQPV
jgi:3-carboxy-cis,cis-muconate cycloisomerase